MTDAGWAAVSSIVGSAITGLIAWRGGNKAHAAKKVAEDVRQQTAEQTVTIDEIDRKADKAVAQSDGRLTKIETQLEASNKELAEYKAQNVTLQGVIERLLAQRDTAPIVVTQPPRTARASDTPVNDLPKKEPTS